MNKRSGVTLLELLVVLFVIGMLSTIAYSVYTAHILRAKIAATAAKIHVLELAASQYEVDTGQYPPSSSGTRLAPGPIDPIMVPGEGARGCGYLMTALLGSLSGDPHNPIDRRWQGPYIEVRPEDVGLLTGEPLDLNQPYLLPQLQMLDSWGYPFEYVRSVDYNLGMATRVPANSPFRAEIWYNPSTIQIVSKGPNGFSEARPNLGLDVDDLHNFRY